MKLKKGQNALELIPSKKKGINWNIDDSGFVIVDVVNTGIYNRIAQVFFNRPKISHISLEKFGSFIWKTIDGKTPLLDIASEVQQQFGKEAEPLYNRLVMYIKILREQDFITLRLPEKKERKT